MPLFTAAAQCVCPYWDVWTINFRKNYVLTLNVLYSNESVWYAHKLINPHTKRTGLTCMTNDSLLGICIHFDASDIPFSCVMWKTQTHLYKLTFNVQVFYFSNFSISVLSIGNEFILKYNTLSTRINMYMYIVWHVSCT